MKLIDADDFIEYLGLNAENSREENLGEIVTLEDFDRQPIIDVEPVRHGKWIFGETKGHSWMKCNQCLKSQSGQTACFAYCPDCGAKMDLNG